MSNSCQEVQSSNLVRLYYIVLNIDDKVPYLVVFLFSLLVVETADRPGLLVDLVKIITDINITVQSGEFDTEVNINVLSEISVSLLRDFLLKHFFVTGIIGQSEIPCQLSG